MSDFISNLVVRAYLASKRDEGQTFAEYGLILTLIALAVVVIAATLGTNISNEFTNVSNKL